MKSFIILFVLTTSTVFAHALTCADGSGRSVAFDGSSFVFKGLDTAGIPSDTKYAIVGSQYVQVPGGPSYSDYSCANAANHAVVRISESGTKTTAQVWDGSSTKSRVVFTGSCTAGSTVSAAFTSGFGTCYNSLNCSGAVVAANVSADECSAYGGYSWDDGSGCTNL